VQHFLLGLGAVLVLVVVYDIVQTRHTILRNFPIIGHFRYLLETVGPELRQYIVTSNNEERPFSRDERSWVYMSAKKVNNTFGFGTDDDLELSNNYIVIKHQSFPLADPDVGEDVFEREHPLPCAKVLGEARGRRQAFRPASIVNISAMSFGSLSRPAIEALNRGAKRAGCLHNTGEGGISRYHLHGGELVWQLGTAYFGARDARGHFDKARFVEQCARHPVRAVEIKLSQGAKPGKGGILPGRKVTEEIAAIRGIPVGQRCVSPPHHTAFHDVDSMLDFVEELAEATGLPVGIKSAVGEQRFWDDLALQMSRTDRGVDFIAVDGGEGGTGAAPLVFSDHVSLPFKIGMSRVYRTMAEVGLHEKVVFIGAGRLGFPEQALLAFALGCDMIGVAREAMLAIGCIQAQRCHTDHCPTGVATQNRWLTRGLVPDDKAPRLGNYVVMLRKEIVEIARACGVPHPSLVTGDQLEILDGRFGAVRVDRLFGYEEGWGLPSEADRLAIVELMGRP